MIYPIIVTGVAATATLVRMDPTVTVVRRAPALAGVRRSRTLSLPRWLLNIKWMGGKLYEGCDPRQDRKVQGRVESAC